MLQQSKDIKMGIIFGMLWIVFFLTVAEIGYVVVCCGGVGC